jgi:phospholipid/cholesterol/gamma-HCH transport system substrate-binding protein
MARGGRDPRNPGISPFKAGLIAAVLILVFSFFGFSRYNPFAHNYKLHATFNSANNLQPKSPVRIAGVDVGKVTTVEPLKTSSGTGAAKVTMEINKKGLPIHKDAELKIRPRIFLEGNFFVDLQPGTPEAATVKDGGDIPVQQTATPVQFGQLLTALQADTRKDLQVLLKEYARNGLGHGGAEAYNKALDTAAGAFRFSSIANQASLGTEPHDLSKLLRGQQRLFRALSTNPGVLKSLIVNLNTTVAALAREDVALAATIPALRDTLRVGRPALFSLNNFLPTLRAFARDALPGVRSSGPTIDASLPFITQARLLVRQQELRGLAHDLRFAIPDLARLNHSTIPLLNVQRALSACTLEVLNPFSKTPIIDPDFAGKTNYDGGQTGQPFKEEGPRSFVGLSGESRTGDANSPMFHISVGTGPQNVILRNEGEAFVSQQGFVAEATRPLKPDHRPVFRPGTPCETQQPPDLHAAKGSPDQTLTATGVVVPPLSKKSASTAKPAAATPEEQKKQTFILNELTSFLKRRNAGLPTPDPMNFSEKDYPAELAAVGLMLDPTGHIVARPGGKVTGKALAKISATGGTVKSGSERTRLPK